MSLNACRPPPTRANASTIIKIFISYVQVLALVRNVPLELPSLMTVYLRVNNQVRACVCARVGVSACASTTTWARHASPDTLQIPERGHVMSCISRYSPDTLQIPEHLSRVLAKGYGGIGAYRIMVASFESTLYVGVCGHAPSLVV